MKVSKTFDSKNGSLQLANGKSITRAATPTDLPELGIKVIRDFDFNTGWYHCTSESEIEATPVPRAIYITLSFENKELPYVSIKLKGLQKETNPLSEAEFYERARLTAPKKFRQYSEFLEQELGVPIRKDEVRMSTVYDYTWGNISVAYDYHNFACSIVMRWS